MEPQQSVSLRTAPTTFTVFIVFRQINDQERQLSGVCELFDIQDMLEAGNWSMLQTAVVNLDLSTLPLPSDLSDSISYIQVLYSLICLYEYL